MQAHPRWTLALATMPLWPIVSLVVLATATRVKLGYWPHDNRLDPNTLDPFPLDIAFVALLRLALM